MTPEEAEVEQVAVVLQHKVDTLTTELFGPPKPQSEKRTPDVTEYFHQSMRDIARDIVTRRRKAQVMSDNAVTDLQTALAILTKDDRLNTTSPFHCEHDTLMVMADPEKFTAAEIAELDDLGIFVTDSYGEQVFQSFRFGSA